MEDKTEGNPIPEQWKGQILPFDDQLKKEMKYGEEKNDDAVDGIIETVRDKDFNRDGAVYKEMAKIQEMTSVIGLAIEKLKTRLRPIINKRKQIPRAPEQNNEQKEPVPCSPLVNELGQHAMCLKRIDDELESILDQLEL
jgi:hypothetical protein